VPGRDGVPGAVGGRRGRGAIPAVPAAAPDIAVAAVRLPSFAAANGTVAFTFQQTASVRNPNRSPLAHFHSSLRVAYAGGELGSVYIPAGLMDGGRTKDMSATFDVPAIPVAQQQPQMGIAAAQQQQPQPVAIEVESLLVVNGRVKMLRLLTHRVQPCRRPRSAASPSRPSTATRWR